MWPLGQSVLVPFLCWSRFIFGSLAILLEWLPFGKASCLLFDLLFCTLKIYFRHFLSSDPPSLGNLKRSDYLVFFS